MLLYIYVSVFCIYIVCSTYVHICAMVQRWYMVYGHNRMRIHPLIWVHNPSIILNMAHIIWKKWKHSKGLCVCAPQISCITLESSLTCWNRNKHEGSFPCSKKAILTLGYFRCEGMHYSKLHLLHETYKGSLALSAHSPTQWASHGGAAEVLHQLLESFATVEIGEFYIGVANWIQ
jgi:hypothetical protein